MTAARSFDLDWLLSPVGIEEFLQLHWETAPLLVRRDSPGYFADLPGLDALDELITATTARRLGHNDDGKVVRTERDGSSSQRAIRLDSNGIPDIQDVYRAYRRGYSVVVNQVHCRSAVVALLCNALEATLHHRMTANLYLSPPDAQGFRPHIDTHDVFVLQLHGVKEWHVSPPTVDLPLVHQKPDAPASLTDFTSHLLTPGDLLYLPRGYWHEAVTTSTSSLHLTVGINVYRWVDLLRAALDLLADDHMELRHALPAGFLDHPLDAAHLRKAVDHFATALAEDDVLAERAKQRLGGRLINDSKAADRGRFRSIDALAGLTGESVVIRPAEVLCRVRTGARKVRIEFLGNYVSRPPDWAETLQFVAHAESFRIGELPGEISPEDKLELVRELVGEGLLLCTDA